MTITASGIVTHDQWTLINMNVVCILDLIFTEKMQYTWYILLQTTRRSASTNTMSKNMAKMLFNLMWTMRITNKQTNPLKILLHEWEVSV